MNRSIMDELFESQRLFTASDTATDTGTVGLQRLSLRLASTLAAVLQQFTIDQRDLKACRSSPSQRKKHNCLNNTPNQDG